MFQVYVTHPHGTFTRTPAPELKSTDLDSALDYAFSRIALIVPNCSVWIETATGEKLALMN